MKISCDITPTLGEPILWGLLMFYGYFPGGKEHHQWNLIIPGGMVHRHFALCYKLLLPLHLYIRRHNTTLSKRNMDVIT